MATADSPARTQPDGTIVEGDHNREHVDEKASILLDISELPPRSGEKEPRTKLARRSRDYGAGCRR